MAYRIRGLDSAPFAPLFDADDAALAARGIVRTVADADRGYPCRISLTDARKGEELLLLNHVSLAVNGPFRASHAIYVRRDAVPAAPCIDRLPAYLASRTLSLRGFDSAGMLVDGRIARPGEGEAALAELLAQPRIAEIHAHNAAYGCFLARIERYEEAAA
jgi:hypothetical protein